MFKKIFNYLILFVLIYIIYMHSKKNKLNENNIDLLNSDVNSSIDMIDAQFVLEKNNIKPMSELDYYMNNIISICNIYINKMIEFLTNLCNNKDDNTINNNETIDEYINEEWALHKSKLDLYSNINDKSSEIQKNTRLYSDIQNQSEDEKVSKSIKDVFDGKIPSFKNNKLSNKNKERIQGNINLKNNLSVLDPESEYQDNINTINANDNNFDNYSLI